MSIFRLGHSRVIAFFEPVFDADQESILLDFAPKLPLALLALFPNIQKIFSAVFRKSQSPTDYRHWTAREKVHVVDDLAD